MLARAGEGAQGKKENKTELEARLLEQEPNSLQWGGRWWGGKDKKATFHSGRGCISGTAGEPRAAGAGCSTADRLQQVQSSLGKP